MADKTDAEGRAWRVLQQPAPRGRYEHVRNWEIRNNHRISFRNRIDRTPGGCWMWMGQAAPRANGNMYALVGWRVRKSGRSALQRSAFTWMMEEWFPEEHAKLPHRTKSLCAGGMMCLNPYHRANGMNTTAKITPEIAVKVYSLKGVMSATAVGEQYGIRPNQVRFIWAGRNWGRYTGAPKPVDTGRRVTPPEVVEEIERLKGVESSAKLAERFGVHKKTVQRIWQRAAKAEAQRLLSEQGT